MLKNDPKKDPLFNYARYSSLAFQMLLIIFLGIWLGRKLDLWLALRFPIFTLLFSFLSVATAIYIAIKDFTNSNHQ